MIMTMMMILGLMLGFWFLLFYCGDYAKWKMGFPSITRRIMSFVCGPWMILHLYSTTIRIASTTSALFLVALLVKSLPTPIYLILMGMTSAM